MLISEAEHKNRNDIKSPSAGLECPDHDLISLSVGATPIEVLYKLLSRDKANGTH